MARGKKKESALTPEEKLAQALVPNWEQPYKVPKNWCWVRFGQLAVDMADGPFGSNLKTEHYTQEKQARIIQLSNIGENGWREENTKYTTFEHAKTISRSIVEPGNIVIAKMMPAGRAIICPNAEAQYVLSSDAVKMIPHSQLNSKYLLFQINSHHFQLQVQENTQGITRARTSIKKLKEYAFAVAPLDEQQRIVDLIEYLFAKLDEAKEKAQSVLETFETRKAAILHKAFTGELTAKWRAAHGIETLVWEQRNITEVCVLRSGTTIPADEELEKGAIPYIKVADMNLPDNSVQILTSSRFVDSCPESHSIPYGSTIFPKRGGAILTNKKRFVGVPQIIADLNTMAIIPDQSKLLGWYGYYWMLSVDLRELNNGSNVPQINNKDMVKLFIPVPTIAEQNEIVRILDSLFAKEQQAKEAAEAVLEKIDLLKKSILARAFRGELGTNDLAEPSAIELIKQILSEKIAVTEPKKPRKKDPPEVNVVAKTIMQALASNRKLTPEKLKAETDLPIDDFYDQLKALIDNGQVVETRFDGEAYLEAKDADRQPNN